MQQLVVVVLYENNKGKILHTQYGIGQLMFIKKITMTDHVLILIFYYVQCIL